MSPRGLAMVLCFLAALSLTIAVLFVMQGAWVVLLFATAEAAALCLAFLVYARRATDGERVWFDGHWLVVERESAGRVSQRVLQAAWLDVRLAMPDAAALTVQCGRESVEIGRCASRARREQVWKEMRQALADRRGLAAGTTV